MERWRVRRSSQSESLSLLTTAFFASYLNSIIILTFSPVRPTESHPGASFKFNHIRRRGACGRRVENRNLLSVLLRGPTLSLLGEMLRG